VPPILIPSIAGPVAFLTAQAYYEAWAGIWVERPAYIYI
jgi:hypothetical protein